MSANLSIPVMSEVVVDANGIQSGYWQDLWSYRELLYFLTWRDILVRYKQTVIGISWALVRPLLSMVVFTVLFGRIAGFPSEGAAPYALLVYVAMLPMQFMTSAISDASNSLVQNPSLVAKIYFPRAIVPASSVMTCLVDAMVSCVALAFLIGWHRSWPDWHIVFLPLFAGLALAVSMGMGVWLCALNVQYRDFRQLVPFALQLSMYVSPVGFSSSLVPQSWRLIYSLNPAVGVIDGFRWSLLKGAAPLYWPGLSASVAVTVVLWVTGIRYFRTVERTFADVI